MRVIDGGGGSRVELSLDSPRFVTVQDERMWNLASYALLVRFSTNSTLQKGDTVSLGLCLKVTGTADHAEAQLSVDSQRRLYTLDGFGGNFVYGIQSPVTRFNLDSLRIAWARTQMNLVEWEPENDNDSATNTNWQVLEGRDVPGATLRQEFVLAQELQKKGVSCVISIWDLPEWLYVNTGQERHAYGRRLAPEKWDELLECMGSYLLYAKRQYGVEPALFSFNECREGVRVQFSAEEHADVIRRIGGHFQRLGLKTRMLLADNASLRGSEGYAIPTVKDAEAMRYVGAISVHSWGGATPAEYAVWNDLSRKINKPLLITELGVDPEAWHTPWVFRTFSYALQELRMYQDVLLHARPQGTMEWEFTSDYGIAEVQKDETGWEAVIPRWRYSFIKHFCNLTPLKAHGLATKSNHPKVLFTAFRGGGHNNEDILVLHIANLGASRMATLSGIPEEIRSVRTVLSTEKDLFKEMASMPVRRGKVSLNLPAQSLLTLTTER
jgi:hypothetical protein